MCQEQRVPEGAELLIKYSKAYWGCRDGEAGQEHGGAIANQNNYEGLSHSKEALQTIALRLC
jgi:hypothetical protein